MVNAAFPGTASYGFELVDSATPRHPHVNGKFTPNQISAFFGNFSES